MKILTILLVLSCIGCVPSGEYYEPTYRISPPKTYNELFPVHEWQIEDNRLAIERINRESW